jgi:hypothetical protein
MSGIVLRTQLLMKPACPQFATLPPYFPDEPAFCPKGLFRNSDIKREIP